MRDDVPYAAYSATMPSKSLKIVMKSLHFNPADTVLINLGNFRSNIYWDVKQLSGTEVAIPEIAPYLPTISVETVNIPLTIIFVNTIEHGILVYDFLVKQHVPAHLREQIALVHSLRGPITKEYVMKEVMNNGRGFLVCTEIAALVSFIYSLATLSLALHFTPNQPCIFSFVLVDHNSSVECYAFVTSHSHSVLHSARERFPN